MYKIMKNKKRLRRSYQSLFGLQKYVEKFRFYQSFTWAILGNDLIQINFSVILKDTFANLCKPIHNVIIIPVSSDPLNLEGMERKAIKPFNQQKCLLFF